MAKSRAQRKAERRAREQEREAGKQGDSPDETSHAQHDTQVGKSGEVAGVDAVEEGIEAGVPEEDLEAPDAPAPARKSRSEKRDEKKRQKEAEKQELEKRQEKSVQQSDRKRKQAQAPHQRGGVIGFLISCWAELKRVQWPDRDTLIQATAVTVIFVAVAAAYLGALDWVFSEVMKVIL